jgi:uncharacterized protein YciI
VLAAALAASCQSPERGAAPSGSQPVTPSEHAYLVVYRAGPKWPAGDPLPEPLRQHFRYLSSLHRRGALKFAGPFADERGGAAVLTADDDGSARALLQADPAVQAQVFAFELHRWRWVDWEGQTSARPDDTSQ